jgi:hypothetical protein
MLAELAVANACFAAVKTALKNGSELAACASQLGEYFGLKAEIAKKASSKGSDSDAFWAMESLREAEAELKEMLIYSGRPGLYDDFLQYQSLKKREREQEVRDKALAIYKRRQKLWGWVNGLIIVISVATGFFVVALLIWAIYTKGQF